MTGRYRACSESDSYRVRREKHTDSDFETIFIYILFAADKLTIAETSIRYFESD